MAGAEGRDTVDIGLDRLRHEGLQEVGLDRKGEARHCGKPRGVPGDRHADLAGADEASRRLYADDLSAVASNAGHLAMFEYVVSAPVGGARKAPDHRVVPCFFFFSDPATTENGEHG